MQGLETLHVQIAEGKHAFNINGVTFGKRHLEATIAKDCDGDMERAMNKFLVIVPFLATAYRETGNESPSVRYGLYKAKRLYKAIGLNEDNICPFMLVALLQAEGHTDIVKTGPETVRSFRQAGMADNVVPFPRKVTIH